MGFVRQQQQRWEEAAALYERTLGVQEACVGRESVGYAQILCSLGEVRVEQQRYDTGMELYEQALGVYEACEGRESEAKADILHS